MGASTWTVQTRKSRYFGDQVPRGRSKLAHMSWGNPPGLLSEMRFAAPLWCPPPVGLDRHLRGLSGSSPRSVLIKICANKKIGEERRGDYPEAGINLEYEGKTNLK